MKKILQMPRRKQTDAQLTAALCRQPGVLGLSLQTKYAVVRSGEEIWVRREALTREEFEIIHAELKKLGQEALDLAEKMEKASS